MGDIDAVLLNAVNRAGNTPLHYAASWGSREMVHYLLEVTSEDTILATGDELLLRLTTGELYGEYLLVGGLLLLCINGEFGLHQFFFK